VTPRVKKALHLLLGAGWGVRDFTEAREGLIGTITRSIEFSLELGLAFVSDDRGNRASRQLRVALLRFRGDSSNLVPRPLTNLIVDKEGYDTQYSGLS